MKLKILFDYQIFGIQAFGGISRYFYEIINLLNNEVPTEITVRYSDNCYLKQKNLGSEVQPQYDPRTRFLSGIEFKGKGHLFKLANRISPARYLEVEALNKAAAIECLRQQQFDVFHPTYYDDYFLDYLGRKPFVLTIHDMTHELFPEFYSSPEELAFLKKKAKLASLASHIIAVSENTKKDIIEVLGIRGEKISVIHHGATLNPKDVSAGLTLPENFLLYVGERAPEYKNFKFMVSGLAPLLSVYKDLYVVCTGRGFSAKERIYLSHFGLEDRFIAKFIPEDSLHYLYSKARTMIFPSYSEGFGIPILEAFQGSCPVILSRSGCFSEIAGQAALYFEPKSMGELRNSVTSILTDEKLRNLLIQKGIERLKDFSWSKAALQTLEVYKSVI